MKRVILFVALNVSAGIPSAAYSWFLIYEQIDYNKWSFNIAHHTLPNYLAREGSEAKERLHLYHNYTIYKTSDNKKISGSLRVSCDTSMWDKSQNRLTISLSPRFELSGSGEYERLLYVELYAPFVELEYTYVVEPKPDDGQVFDTLNIDPKGFERAFFDYNIFTCIDYVTY